MNHFFYENFKTYEVMFIPSSVIFCLCFSSHLSSILLYVELAPLLSVVSLETKELVAIGIGDLEITYGDLERDFFDFFLGIDLI